jgi:hypothetical protein
MSHEKTKQVRCSISAGSAAVLEKLSKEGAFLSQTQWAAFLLDSAASAVRDAGYTFKFPLKLQIVTDPEKVGLSCRK